MFHLFPSRPAPSPGSVGRADRGVSGSLLAETLLVLPVYLMLLGGLFVVGDILLARIRGGVLDRTAAWLRPGGALGNHGIAQHHRVWEGTDSAIGWYGMKLGDPKDSSVAPVRSWGVSLDDNRPSENRRRPFRPSATAGPGSTKGCRSFPPGFLFGFPGLIRSVSSIRERTRTAMRRHPCFASTRIIRVGRFPATKTLDSAARMSSRAGTRT